MNYARQYMRELNTTLAAIDLDKVDEVISRLREARDSGRQIFVCGNGGSAGTASHFVCDMVKGASYGRAQRFRILSLNDNIPTLTAYSNDVGYECVFVEQLKNFAQPDDIVLAISGSGNSPNVVRAVDYAAANGCLTVALTGRDGGKLGPLADIHINVPVPHMGRIEDAHMVICHLIAYCFMEDGS